MSYLYSDSNLMNNTETILQMIKAQQAEKRAFGNSVLAEVSNDSFNKTTKPVINTSSSNSTDDGKISFKEKMTNFGKGLVAPIKNMFSSPKNIALTALSAAGGAALIALTGGAAAPVMVAAGLIGGGVQIGKGIYKQSKATTDEQARQAWQQMGTGTFTVGVSAAGAKSALKANGVDVTGMSTLKAGVKCITDTPKNIVKGVSTASGKISAFMASSDVAAETPTASTRHEIVSDTAENTPVETPETKPVSDTSKRTVTKKTENLEADAPKTAPETAETPVKSAIETPETDVSAPIKEIAAAEVKTARTPTETSVVETPKTQTVEQPASVVETSTTVNTADTASRPVTVEVPESVVTETSASTPKSAPKTGAGPKNYTKEILLQNGKIVKIDMTPKSYSEMVLDKYKMAFEEAKAQEAVISNADIPKAKVSILGKLKDIFKVFGFFKPKKI